MVNIEKLKRDLKYWLKISPPNSLYYWPYSGDWYRIKDREIQAFYNGEWRKACHGFRLWKPEIITKPER